MSLLVNPITVSSVTTATLFSVISFIFIIILVVLLITKEIFTTSTRHWALALTKMLNIVIIPLLIVFSMIFVVNLVQLIR
jgi:hypothetical protein